VLIVISDLHLMDGSAAAPAVEPGVFRATMSSLAAHAREARAAEIMLVLLGDVFDLVRTERWFDRPLEDRPWGTSPSTEALFDIFDGVVENNAELLGMLSGSLVEQFGFPVEPERVYIPGNHDTFVNEHPELRRRVRELLGMRASEELFPRHLLDPEHSVFARHGSEFDPYNFEGSKAYDAGELDIPEEDHRLVSIGDAMACEFATRAAPLAAAYLPEGHPARDQVVARLRDAVDVRPMSALAGWVLWQGGRVDGTARECINRAIGDAARTVDELPFTQEWYEKNDRLGWEHADALQTLLRLLRSLQPTNYERVIAAAEKIASFAGASGDRYATAAAEDLRRLERYPDGRDVHYVVYGHTHAARQVPLAAGGDGAGPRDRVYFNVGTWRPAHRPTHAGDAFTTWKTITYLVFYRPGELGPGGRPVKHATVQSWTGTAVGG
jgi:UDP-2,3-diacylglucosamine pyrophosphatase LpxH